jgi:hypothetical protein
MANLRGGGSNLTRDLVVFGESLAFFLGSKGRLRKAICQCSPVTWKKSNYTILSLYQIRSQLGLLVKSCSPAFILA